MQASGRGRTRSSAWSAGCSSPRPGASAAIGLGYSRRHVPWLVLTIVAAIALCGIAGLARTSSHPAWLVAVSAESGLVALGLFRFAYARYMGGTLLAIAILGTLLHPAVAAPSPGFSADVSLPMTVRCSPTARAT